MSNHYQSSHHKQNKHNGQKYNSSNKHVEKYGSQSQHRSGGQSTPRTEQRSRQKVAAFDIKATLDKVPLLSSLGKSQKRQLAKELITKVFHPGQDIMREGEEGDFFLIIIDGKVDVKSSKAGHLAFLGEGDYAGEQALLKATTRNATLTAVDTTTCLLCSKHTFDKIKKSVKFANREGKKRRAFATKVNKDDMKMPAVEAKPQETVEWILECVSDNLLFLKLDRDQKERVVQRMVLVKVAKGKALIRQGDTNAQTFYVTDRGTFDILVDGVKVGQYKRGGCFGELALLYDSPRAATILATSTAAVWEVNRNAFRYEIEQASRSRNDANVNFLKRVDLFKPLLREELCLVADALEVTKHKKGSVIIAEGEVGDKFYIIQRGVCEWSKSDGQCGDISAPGFFGERALRTKAKRAATITAKTNVTLYEMTKGDFESLLGPVIEIVDDKIRQYRRMQEKFEKEKRKSELLAQKKHTGHKNKHKHENLSLMRDPVCDLGDLVSIGVLGKGAFGLVSLVVDPHSNKSYALKAIKKHQIVELGQQAHIISEKRVMQKMYNKFLVNLHKTYKDLLRVYFVLDVCLGGELFTILRQRRYFDEPTAKFYTSCVVEAFAYMHSKDIIYRDLKPENLVLDNKGYLKVTDFGFAKEVHDKTFTLCGTPDYLAPEIVTGQGHGRAVDWWTLGVLIYEMLASFPPFFDDEPIETYRKIIRGRVKFPRYFTPEARDLIRGLLRNKPTKRLGILKGGAQNIRKHGWFYGFNWDKLYKGTLTAPIINKVRNNKDLSNFVNSEEDEEDEEALPVAPQDDFGDE
eukprot:4299_1